MRQVPAPECAVSTGTARTKRTERRTTMTKIVFALALTIAALATVPASAGKGCQEDLALHGVVVASGSAVAQSPAVRLAGPSGLSNRYDPPVSETDVGRADQQHAGWIERDEFPSFDGSRIILAR